MWSEAWGLPPQQHPATTVPSISLTDTEQAAGTSWATGTAVDCIVRAVGISLVELEWVASIFGNTATVGFKLWATGTAVAGYNQPVAGNQVIIHIATTAVSIVPERQWRCWLVPRLVQSFLHAFAFCVWHVV